jgi:hypothetical protein
MAVVFIPVARVAAQTVDRVLPVRTELVWRITDERDSLLPSVFGRGNVVIADSGHIVVLDAARRRVLVLDKSGRRIAVSGRRGSGPGEMQLPSQMYAGTHGAVSIWDDALFRLIELPSSNVLRDGPVVPAGLPRPSDGMVAASSGYYFAARRDSATYLLAQLRHVSPQGVSVSLFSLAIPLTVDVSYPTCDLQLGRVPPLLARQLVWTARGDTIVAVATDTYAVYVWVAARRVVVQTRAIEARRATDADARLSLPAAGLSAVRGGARCTVPPSEVIARRGVAERMPIIRSVLLAADGSILVDRSDTAGGTRWDIISIATGYRETVVGTPFPVAAFSGYDVLLAVEDAATGVNSLERRAIRAR